MKEIVDLFNSFSHSFSVVNIIDVIIVVCLLFILYKSLKGSPAINIFLGLLLLYVLYFFVKQFNFQILTEILDRVINLGVLGVIIVFQPEARKFLINLGKNLPIRRNNLISKFIQNSSLNQYPKEEHTVEQISKALQYFIENKLGALIVIYNNFNILYEGTSGVEIDGKISSKLLESIFEKNSPLHDGAVIINKDKIVSARIVLPISDDTSLPSRVGLRHRAAVGATENNESLVIIVSEEKNNLSYAEGGKLFSNISLDEIKKKMFDALLKY